MEIVAVDLELLSGDKLAVAVCYIPPKTGAWGNEEYRDLTKETLHELKVLARRSKSLLICGDFNCKEVDWENFEVRGIAEGGWGSELLNFCMENAL